jgi:hypothetical protein
VKIDAIKTLAVIAYDVEAGAPCFVATQTHPEHWSELRDRDLQWFIDANWLIKTPSHTYDPRQP